MREGNVLSRRNRPTTKSYRSAVKQIVLNLQAQHGLNDAELAEHLGCSASTIKNARTESNNLDGVTLANVEYEFGPGAVDPFLALSGARSVPNSGKVATSGDPSLAICDALRIIIETQHESSPGGRITMASEVRPHIFKLRAARAELDRLVALAESPSEPVVGVA